MTRQILETKLTNPKAKENLHPKLVRINFLSRHSLISKRSAKPTSSAHFNKRSSGGNPSKTRNCCMHQKYPICNSAKSACYHVFKDRPCRLLLSNSSWVEVLCHFKPGNTCNHLIALKVLNICTMSLRAIVRDYGNQISIFAFGAKSCEKETLGTHTGRNLIFQSNRTTTDYSDSASILHDANVHEFCTKKYVS